MWVCIHIGLFHSIHMVASYCQMKTITLLLFFKPNITFAVLGLGTETCFGSKMMILCVVWMNQNPSPIVAVVLGSFLLNFT